MHDVADFGTSDTRLYMAPQSLLLRASVIETVCVPLASGGRVMYRRGLLPCVSCPAHEQPWLHVGRALFKARPVDGV